MRLKTLTATAVLAFMTVPAVANAAPTSHSVISHTEEPDTRNLKDNGTSEKGTDSGKMDPRSAVLELKVTDKVKLTPIDPAEVNPSSVAAPRLALDLAPERVQLSLTEPAPEPEVVEQQAPVAEQQTQQAPAPAPAPPLSATGNVVVDAAMAQQGVPYVWGGTSPAGFDCSGLTSYAYAQAGKSIPRTSQAQLAGGTPVPLDALQPGDIIGYYPGVTHVAIYIGNGQVVHSPTYGQTVTVSDLYHAPVSGAVRY